MDLGDAMVKVNSDSVPDFEDLAPSKCKISWTVILSTVAGKSEIDDVFIFVDLDSTIEIEILSEKDLFKLSNARSTFEYVLFNKPNEPESL